MINQLKKVSLSLALIAGLGVIGCGDDDNDLDDEVEELFDCAAICTAFDVCIDNDDFDRSGCTSDCENNADASNSFENQAEDCTDCVDDADSCVEGVFECADECDGIVP